jgi:hypothetical protein
MARVSARLAPLLALLLVAGASAAHELRPAYLELRELGDGRYEARFRVPTRDGRALPLRAVLPDACRESSARSLVTSGAAREERFAFACPGGLAGRELRIDGLAATLTDVLVRVERADGTAQVARLLPRSPALRVEAAPGTLSVAQSYLALGVEHVLGGPDHLLFLLALLWIVRGSRQLVATISAFTLAHSLTLAAAALGVLRLPAQPVEAAIALSIAFLAREIVCAGRGRSGLGSRRPWLVAFAFGLLHGFGFAGALREVGLPERAIPLALLCFNAGVELGQLGFAALAIAPAAAALRLLPKLRWPEALPAYAIGALASFWTIERVIGFFG